MDIWLRVWVVVKIMVHFRIPIITRHPIFRVPKNGTIILTTSRIGFKGLGSQGFGFRAVVLELAFR